MKKLFVITGMLALSLSVVRCGSSSGGTPAVPLTAGGVAFKSVNDSLNGAKGLSPVPPAAILISSHDDVDTYGAGLTAFWSTDAFMSNPKYDGTCSAYATNVSLKEYMGSQFSENQKRCNGSAINIFGRIKQSAGELCVMMNSLNATTSVSLVGAAPLVLTMNASTKASLQAQCPDIDLSQPSLPSTITFTFSAPAVNANYDLRVAIAPFGDTVLIKYGTGSVINFADSENNSNGYARTMISYDTVAKVLKAEYVSKSKGSQFPLYVHRLFKDETNDIGRIFSSIQFGFAGATTTTPTNVHNYIVSGAPNGTSTTLAFSTDLTGYSAHNSAFEAYVTAANGTITTDGPALTANAFGCGATANASFATAAANLITAPTTGTAIMTATATATPTFQDLSSTTPAILWTNRDNMLTTGF